MNIYIGYESSHPEMFEVCKESILRFNPTHKIYPLIKSDLQEQGIYTRKEESASTEFAFTRFLVPYLSNYTGWSLFCDGDFLWRCDPQEIVHHKNSHKSVMCVKHPQFILEDKIKMDGKINRPYPKKYWSSLMYFNNALCNSLSLWYVNNAAPVHLHGFTWALGHDDTDGVGDLPASYNAMVGYYDFGNYAKAVHFTDGGPWLGDHNNFKHPLYEKEWINLSEQLKTKKSSL